VFKSINYDKEGEILRLMITPSLASCSVVLWVILDRGPLSASDRNADQFEELRGSDMARIGRNGGIQNLRHDLGNLEFGQRWLTTRIETQMLQFLLAKRRFS